MFQTRSVEQSAGLIEALLNKKFLPKISNAKLQTIDWSARKNRPSAHKVSQTFCAVVLLRSYMKYLKAYKLQAINYSGYCVGEYWVFFFQEFTDNGLTLVCPSTFWRTGWLCKWQKRVKMIRNWWNLYVSYTILPAFHSYRYFEILTLLSVIYSVKTRGHSAFFREIYNFSTFIIYVMIWNFYS